MAYSFSPAAPPRLKDHNGNIFDVPASDLEQAVGKEATWTSTPTPAPDGAVVTKTFRIRRRLFWSLSQIPIHYSSDQVVKIKYVTGYSKTQKESMEKSIGGKVGGSFFGLTAEITGALKLTTDYTQEWHEETAIETEVKYEKNNTYCAWRLNDIIELDIETATAAPGQPPSITLSSAQDKVLSVISIYYDSAEDKDQQIATNASFSGKGQRVVLVAAPQ